MSSTIFCIDGDGSLVIKLTTTITTKQIGAPICLVVMVVVSLMTKEPSPATQKMVDDTRIPTGKPILGKQ